MIDVIDDEFRERALSFVEPRRRAHVEGVAAEAEFLAKRWGVDIEDAVTAALLHDCTKRIKGDEQLKLCERYGIIVRQAELDCPEVLHALTGAEFALREFGVPRGVADAIRTHTTGEPGMTLLQRIIYLADIIEPTRDFPGVDELRALARSDLRSALISAAVRTVTYLCEGRRAVHHATIDTYNSLLREKDIDINRI